MYPGVRRVGVPRAVGGGRGVPPGPYTIGQYPGNHQHSCSGCPLLPVGGGARYLSVYSTRGPSVYTTRCVIPAVLPDTLQAGTGLSYFSKS